MSPPFLQKALEMAWGFIAVAVIAGIVMELRREKPLREQDELQARAHQRRWSEDGLRGRVVSRKPEWYRRWERKVVGVNRLGEAKRRTFNGAKRT